MKYTLQSNKYVFKNFWYIFPFAILPAAFLAFSTDEESILCLMQTLFGTETELHFHHFFNAISVLNFASWQNVLSGTLGVLLLVPCVALMMALLEKHMRIGKRTFNGIFSKLNDNILSTAWYALLLLAIYEVWSLITAALLFFMFQIPVAPLAYTLAALTFLGMHVVLIYAIGTIYLWLPCMQITGFRALEALQYSYQLIAPVKWEILTGQIVGLLCAEALLAVCVLFVPESITFLVLTVVFAFLVMLFCVRMQVAYFDRDNIERADLKRYGRF